MTAVTYENLALGWQPDSKRDHVFNVIAVIVLVTMLSAAVVLSIIELPKEERKARAVVPERVADFILKKEKPKIVKPKPKPKPKPPPIKSKVRKKPKPEAKKPLTKQQKTARKKAEASGLLALGNELADLMDTSEINSMVGKKISRSSSSTQMASVDKGVLTAGATKGSGGVDSDKYTSSVSKTTLSDQQRIALRQSLGSGGTSSSQSAKSKKGRGGNVRAEEDVILVLDKNKGKLQALYNRARRHNPGLKGRIVFLITIAPSGKVTNVKIKSSELNDKKLEQRLVARLKGYHFGKTSHETVTVTFPLEFVPS